MKSNKKWYQKYNYDLMDQQFKIEFAKKPNFNIDEEIKELLSERKDKWRHINSVIWMGYEPEDEDYELYDDYGRIIKFWKRYKLQKAIS
jgi:hypothetical protein